MIPLGSPLAGISRALAGAIKADEGAAKAEAAATPPTPEEKDRERRAREVLVTPPEGKWANPRPFGMGRHTKRYLNRRTGEVILVGSTRTPPWVKARGRKARRKAQTRARRLNRA